VRNCRCRPTKSGKYRIRRFVRNQL